MMATNGTTQPTCQNCSTSTTPLWRRDEFGSVLCNACGLFLKLHGRPRPISLKTDVIKSRNRVKAMRPDMAPKKKVLASSAHLIDRTWYAFVFIPLTNDASNRRKPSPAQLITMDSTCLDRMRKPPDAPPRSPPTGSTTAPTHLYPELAPRPCTITLCHRSWSTIHTRGLVSLDLALQGHQMVRVHPR